MPCSARRPARRAAQRAAQRAVPSGSGCCTTTASRPPTPWSSCSPGPAAAGRPRSSARSSRTCPTGAWSARRASPPTGPGGGSPGSSRARSTRASTTATGPCSRSARRACWSAATSGTSSAASTPTCRCSATTSTSAGGRTRPATRSGWSPTRWCTTVSCPPGRSARRRPPAAIRACSTGAARCTCSRSTCRSGPCSGRWPAAWPGPWSARPGACSPSSSARPPPSSARWPGCCGIRCCCGASAAAGPPTASTATRCCAASCRAPGRWAGSPSRRWACCPAGRATTAAGCTTPWWTSQATTCRCPRPTRPSAACSPARVSCSSSAWPWSRWSRSGR